jgi:hypothetical protein
MTTTTTTTTTIVIIIIIIIEQGYEAEEEHGRVKSTKIFCSSHAQ